MIPTHSRHILLRLILALAVIRYLDHLCICAAMLSITAKFISRRTSRAGDPAHARRLTHAQL